MIVTWLANNFWMKLEPHMIKLLFSLSLYMLPRAQCCVVTARCHGSTDTDLLNVCEVSVKLTSKYLSLCLLICAVAIFGQQNLFYTQLWVLLRLITGQSTEKQLYLDTYPYRR